MYYQSYEELDDAVREAVVGVIIRHLALGYGPILADFTEIDVAQAMQAGFDDRGIKPAFLAKLKDGISARNGRLTGANPRRFSRTHPKPCFYGQLTIKGTNYATHKQGTFRFLIVISPSDHPVVFDPTTPSRHSPLPQMMGMNAALMTPLPR
jgi:hypothetical protein